MTTNRDNGLELTASAMKCLLKCVLGLSEEEAQVLELMLKKGGRWLVIDIAKALDRNPEVVRRALRRLTAKNLVVRRPYPLRRGGRAYIYEVPENVAKEIAGLCSKIDMVLEQARLSVTPVGVYTV